MFSLTAEYALRGVAFLAENPAARYPTQVIAEATRIPPRYLGKVLQSLAVARLVLAQRGPSGGFSLARPPETISVYEVLQAVDPLKRIVTCPLNLDAHRVGLCRVHAQMDRALALVEQAFREATIADLLDPEDPLAACPPRGERTLHP